MPLGEGEPEHDEEPRTRRLSAYRTRKRVLEHNIPASPPASLPRQSTVGTFPYPRRWPGRNSVRRSLRYGILEPAELVADFSGVRAYVQDGQIAVCRPD